MRSCIVAKELHALPCWRWSWTSPASGSIVRSFDEAPVLQQPTAPVRATPVQRHSTQAAPLGLARDICPGQRIPYGGMKLVSYQAGRWEGSMVNLLRPIALTPSYSPPPPPFPPPMTDQLCICPTDACSALIAIWPHPMFTLTVPAVTSPSGLTPCLPLLCLL